MTISIKDRVDAGGPPFNPDREERYSFPEEMAGAQRIFTFLVDFAAHDEDHAQLLAERYARGMNRCAWKSPRTPPASPSPET